MAIDSIKVKPGTGPQAVDVAVDRIGGVDYPVYKHAFGAEDEVALVSKDNALPVDPQLQKTAFGELSVAELTPIVQVQFQYNINAALVKTNINNGGTVTQSDSMAVLQTSANANAYANMNSVISISYNPGQGALMRGTAIFTTGVGDSSQWIGVGDIGDGYFFGFNGADFGVMRRQGGQPEIRILAVTTKSTTAEDITITLDGDAKSDVTVSDATATDATTTANEIAAADYSEVGTGWAAVADGTTVVFISFDAASHSGTYSVSGTTVAGIAIQLIAGAVPTETFVAQTAWNSDRFLFSTDPSNSPSGVTLDPTMGNVYQIKYQWLGFGAIDFSIENPATGQFDLVHRIQYANANTSPSIDDPALPIVLEVKNDANTTNLTLKTASLGGFTAGKEENLGLLKGSLVSAVAVAATEIPIISIRNKFDYQSQRNRVSLLLSLLSVSNDAKNISIKAKLNPTLTGNAFNDVDTNTSVVSIDTAATAISGGEDIGLNLTLNKNESKDINLAELDFKLNPGDVLSFTGTSEAAGTTASLAVNWKELF